jgi:ribonuclease Y
MTDPVVLAVVAVVATIAFVVGFFARSLWASQAVRVAQDKSARIVAEARAQQKELILQAKDEQMRMQRELDEEGRTKRGELSALERRLLQRDEQLDQRTDMLEERDRKLLGRERELDGAKEELARARQEQIAALERVSQLSQEEAKQLLLEEVRLEAEHDAVRLARAIERKAKEDAED